MAPGASRPTLRCTAVSQGRAACAGGRVDRSAAKRALEGLIQRRRETEYSSKTSEANIRTNLVEPLLREVLGWDTHDLREYDREHFARGSGIADGVCLKDTAPVVYVEAKRLGGIPAVDQLKSEAFPRFYTAEEEQALRYARRSLKMPAGERWTVLTNFDRLRVFEATNEERVLSFESFDEMLERLDDLLLLSKDQLLSGALARYTARRTKDDVDEEFRKVLNIWRLGLAQDVYNRNREHLTNAKGEVDLLTVQRAVQRLLDRLIIIQFAADVDALADADPLRELLARSAPPRSDRALVVGRPLREELFDVFRRFDALYNTTLFTPGHVLETLEFGDDVLRYIAESIASQSFRRFDADILGATYETYLGHQLRLTAGKVELELRPELRRAGGVYYTPAHVVREIVDKTLGPLLAAAKSLADVDAITVVDPACGSGSFLIRAFDLFADWYEAENERRKTALAARAAVEVKFDDPDALVHEYGKRILERNLYGVDLDPEAAELATVNLIMQALRRGQIGLDLSRLPLILGQNVKIGNSVVPGYKTLPDSFVDALPKHAGTLRTLRDARVALRGIRDPKREQSAYADEEGKTAELRTALDGLLASELAEPRRRSPFYWPVEFPEVFDPDKSFEAQGFACVIGNPPWIGFYGDNDDRPYLGARYRAAVGRFDVYVPFVELGLGILREGGRFGFITPSNFFLRDYGIALRKILKREFSIERVVDFADTQLFRGATNYPAILVIRNEQPSADDELLYLRKTYDDTLGRRHRQSNLDDDSWVFLTDDEARLFEHIEHQGVRSLGEICRNGAKESGLAEGVITGQNEVFLVPRAAAEAQGLEHDLLRPCLKGEDVTRWGPPPPERVLVYPYVADVAVTEDHLKKRPRLYAHLTASREVPSKNGGLKGRNYFDRSPKKWYELWNQRSEALLGVPKIVTPEVNDRPEFALVGAEVAFTNSVTSATPSAVSGVCREYLAGLLNSRLLALYHARHSVPKANGFLIYTPAFLKRLPILVPNMGDATQRRLHDRIVANVTELVALARERHTLVTDFRYYVQDYALKGSTLQGLLNRLPIDAKDVLCGDYGKLIRLFIERERDGALLLSGRVQLQGLSYLPGGFNDVEIMRLRVPEPHSRFLECYIPVAAADATQRRPPKTETKRRTAAMAHRSLASKAGDLILPTMTDAEMGEVMRRYEPVIHRAGQIEGRRADLEANLQTEVAEIYGLTPEMRSTISEFRLPAELAREEAVVEEGAEEGVVASADDPRG